MSDNVAQDFFNKQSEEEQKALQDSVDNASSEGKAILNKLKVSGSFLMEVQTFIFKDNKGKMKKMPNYDVSSTKGSLILTVPLAVVDECPGVPKGSSIITTITLCPAPGADQTKRDNVSNMMKPQIVALTGEESISMTPEWFDEWLVPKYEEKNGRYNLIKDHKMKNKVMVLTEMEEYQGKIKPVVKYITKAKDGDHSVPDEIIVENETSQDIKTPSDSEFSKESNISNSSIEDAVDDGSGDPVDYDADVAATPVKDVTPLPDDF